MWRNIVDRCRPHGACAFHAGYLELQTHTHTIQYLLLSHSNMLTRTRPTLSLHAHWLLFLSLHLPVATSRSTNLTGHLPSSNTNNHPHHHLSNKEVICCPVFILDWVTPQKGQIVCSVPSVNNNRCTLRNISEERRSQPHRSGRLQISHRPYWHNA